MGEKTLTKKTRTVEEIEKLLKQCEEYILADRDYGDLKNFPFYKEVNTKLITIHGLRKVLLWFLKRLPNNCRRINKEYSEDEE